MSIKRKLNLSATIALLPTWFAAVAVFIGTMGESPDVSVLNPFNQVWDAPNLIVTDASAFPGSGIAGTTLTVMALTIRACRNLVDRYRAEQL